MHFKGRKKSRNGNAPAQSNESNKINNTRIHCERNCKSGAVKDRLTSPIGRGMPEDTSPSPTTPPKLKKMPETSLVPATNAKTLQANSPKSVAAKKTDYFCCYRFRAV